MSNVLQCIITSGNQAIYQIIHIFVKVLMIGVRLKKPTVNSRIPNRNNSFI